MLDVYLRSIEPLTVIVLGCMCGKGAQADEVRRLKKDDRRTATILPKGEYNAQLLRKSWIRQSRAMRGL
jgi:hypothetical protein